MLRALVFLAAILASAAGGKAPRKSHMPKDLNTLSSSASSETTLLTVSFTATPTLTLPGGEVVDDQERMVQCQAALALLRIDFFMRHQDGQVRLAIFSRERGEEHGHPHLQGLIQFVVTGDPGNEEKKRRVAAEKQHIKELLSNWQWCRTVLKQVRNGQDVQYVIGYVQKDLGRDHYVMFMVGMSEL